MEKLSPLQIERLKYQPKLPSSLVEGINSLEMVEGSATQSVANMQARSEKKNIDEHADKIDAEMAKKKAENKKAASSATNTRSGRR